MLRAAGCSGDPQAGLCSQILQDIMQICHRVAISQEIADEWDKHQSTVAKKWRRSMVAKKKLKTQFLAGIDAIRADLENQVNEKVPDAHSKKKSELQKDLHLLTATAATDGVLITNDQKLKDLCDSYGVTSRVEWMILAPSHDLQEHRDRSLERLKDLATNHPNPPLP